MQEKHPPLTDAFTLFEAGRAAEALAIIQHHAAAGEPDALFTLADMYWRGAGVARDQTRGRELFEVAADAGQPMAVRAYTNLLSNGVAGLRDWTRALARLEHEARSDELRAQMLSVIRAMGIDSNGDPMAVPTAERLSERPDVRLYRRAFSPAECDFLRLLAEPTYERSVVVAGERDLAHNARTSDGSTIHWLIEDPATHAINRRLATLAGLPVENGEPLQILRYRPGQEYRPHVDWLSDANRRVTTALIYLNDDYEGGETAFVKTGLTNKGRKGDALVFSSKAPDGSLEPLSEHAGLPLIRGTKYLASRWMRERRFIP